LFLLHQTRSFTPPRASQTIPNAVVLAVKFAKRLAEGVVVAAVAVASEAEPVASGKCSTLFVPPVARIPRFPFAPAETGMSSAPTVLEASAAVAAAAVAALVAAVVVEAIAGSGLHDLPRRKRGSELK